MLVLKPYHTDLLPSRFHTCTSSDHMYHRVVIGRKEWGEEKGGDYSEPMANRQTKAKSGKKKETQLLPL